MPTAALKTFLFEIDAMRPLRDGTVKPSGFDMDVVDDVSGPDGVRRMVRGLDFDVAEIALAAYLCARAYGIPMTAIPVFPHRTFHHDIVYYNPRSGIKSPADLQGRRVGIRSYVLTPAIWARGMLQADHGVDLNSITWVRSYDEHIQQYEYPPNVVLGPQDKDMAALLAAGEYDAALWFGKMTTPHPDIQPLFPDTEKAAAESYAKTGVYPMNHVIVVRDDVLKADPAIAREIYGVFKAARDHYLAHLDPNRSDLPPESQALLRNQAIIGGELLPYGIEKNRRTLEAMVQDSFDQKIIPQKVSVEEIFAPNTLDLE